MKLKLTLFLLAVDCISLAAGCHLTSSVMDGLVAWDRYDDSVTRLIHHRPLVDAEAEDSETLYSSSSDQDNAYEYDDDIYGYLNDYAY